MDRYMYMYSEIKTKNHGHYQEAYWYSNNVKK